MVIIVICDRALIKSMKIANDKTFEQFDKLKEQLTAHKRKSTNNQTQTFRNKPSARFRWVLPLFLIVGGGWLVYRNTPTLQEYLLQKGRITYQQSLAWKAVQSYLSCKWLQATSNHRLVPSKTLANNCYIARLQSDLLFLTERSPEKKLHIQTNSSLSMGFFGWGNTEKIRYINPHGDLVEKHRTSKLMLGNLMRIWSKTTERLLQRQRVFGYYEKEMKEIGNQCEQVNWLAQWELKKEEHEYAVRQCQEESRKVSEKLRKVVEERLKAQKKLYKI